MHPQGTVTIPGIGFAIAGAPVNPLFATREGDRLIPQGVVSSSNVGNLHARGP